MQLPTWEVDLNVYGPVSVQAAVHLREPKGFSLPDPFQSDVRIKSFRGGVQITATAYASNLQNARKVTLVFIGYMLDALTLNINMPLYLSYTGSHDSREGFSERRFVPEHEWHDAFREARLLALTESTFLRALGWYRKGLYSNDALDSFLAYWNAIEIVAGKYHPNREEARKGSKSQIWECYKLLWGECPQWPVIADQTNWIDQNYEIRKNIAHGTGPITVESVENVIEKLPIIRSVAYQFLIDWRHTQLNPRVPPGFEHQFGY
jgi:hypothetical protein